MDESSETVYVGFNGGDLVVQLDYTLNILGILSLPSIHLVSFLFLLPVVFLPFLLY